MHLGVIVNHFFIQIPDLRMLVKGLLENFLELTFHSHL